MLRLAVRIRTGHAAWAARSATTVSVTWTGYVLGVTRMSHACESGAEEMTVSMFGAYDSTRSKYHLHGFCRKISR